MKLFINKYNWKGINFPSEKDDWKKIQKNNRTIAQGFVRSPDGDTEFFDIIAGVLQGNNFEETAEYKIPC